MKNNILEVKKLQTSFFTSAGEVQAVNKISFSVGAGEAVGIVGESGSGKSVTSLSIMRLLPSNGRITGGQVLYNGNDLLNLEEKNMQSIRGNDISMIFQDPMTSLNPVYTVGNQIMEPLMHHQKMNSRQARIKAVEMLKLVGIPDPEKRIKQYPHEFSGGMRQRAMIAMALSCEPRLLIADEPTTALDVTIQAQILELMKDLKNKLHTSIILITHDLGVVTELCSRIIVMYGGQIMESGPTKDLFYQPGHPYTWGLLRSIPSIRKEKSRLIPIDGQPPDLLHPPAGCPFFPRCEHAMRICQMRKAPLTKLTGEHEASCWLLHTDAPPVERK